MPPTSSGSGNAPGAAAPTGPAFPDYTGTWDVSGVDSSGGAYQGTAVLSGAPVAYTVQKLVTLQAKTPTGSDVLWAWNATAHEEAGGLRVDATLRRAHVFASAGSVTRQSWDRQPLALTALLTGPQGAVGPIRVGTAMSGTFTTSSGPGPQETWTRSTTAAPAFPQTQAHLEPGHAAPAASVRSSLFTTFAGYHQLPQIAPYVARADFQAAIHGIWIDRTAFDFYRQRGPSAVVVLDKVLDDVSVAEETRRANAYSRRLVEKAKLFEDDTATVCADANGMVTAMDSSSGTPRKDFAQSPVLYTGTWALSQLYRYQATRDPAALDNIERAARGAAICIDISPDKTQFARGIDLLANAQPGQVGPGGKYGWVAGTASYANLMWMQGGNNDMLHGIEGAFIAAVQALPAGNATRDLVGQQAASLLDNVKIARSGIHEIELAYAASAITGDPKWQSRYSKALGWKNILDKLYLRAGGTFLQTNGIGDWSGHNLGAFSSLGLRALGGATPSADEQDWRNAADEGIAAGFASSGKFRMGIVAAVAAAANVPGAADTVTQVLAEIPYPKATGNVVIDYSVSDDWSVSPYPSMPWKVDWMTNPGRVQALTSQPYFYRGSDQNYWNRSPLALGAGPDGELEPGQDYLVVYWLARSAGVVGPND